MFEKNSPPYIVSAVVSAFNSENHLSGRLQNLTDQTLFREGRLEIIVVDSCSSQNEGDITKRFMRQFDHIIYVRTSKRESVYGAWNRGIGLANAKYFINANTDDRFAIDALAQMSSELSEDYGVHAVYGDWLQTTVENDTFDSETRKELISYPEFNPILFFHSQITSHAALIHKNVFDKIGPYNDAFKVYGDREFMLRFSANGFKAKKIPEVVGLYFKNPNGLEFSEKELGDLEFKKLLNQFLLPEHFIRLFNRDEIPGKKDLAQMYACAGQHGIKFFKIDGKPVSNPGTAGLLFSKAFEYDESNIVSLNNLAIIASASGETNQGIQLFEKALAVADPEFGLDIHTNITIAKNGSTSLDDYNWCGTGYYKNHKPKEIIMKSPQELYQDSQTIISAGRYEDGITELQKLLQIYPDHAAAHNDLGVLFYHLGDKEQALQHYELASKLQPENTTLQKNLADFYYVELGRVEDALRIYVQILETHPEDIETLMITGHICVALQKFEDAQYFYKRALEIEPWNADAGQNLEKLQGIVSESNTSQSADEMYQAAQAAANEGRVEEAILKLETLLGVSPGFAIAYNDLGVLHYQIGAKDRAREHYEKAVQLEPDNTTFQKNLADFYYVELGRVEDALRIYVRILETHPEDIETLMITGHICVALQKFEDARDLYHRVLEIQPWNSDAGQNLNKLQKILAGNVTPQSADEMYQAAQKEVNEGHIDEAILKLETLLGLSPDFARAHNDLGVLYFKAGDKVRAREHYEKAAELEPGDIIFQKNLADFYCIEMDQLESAMQIYVRILENYPEDIEVLMAIGYICETVNNLDDARDFYHRVLGIEPWNMDARQKLDNLNVMRKAV